MTTESLPSFARPPVVETVLGVQFDPLPKFTNAHLGAYWKSLGPEWPEVADAPRLELHFERFAEDRTWSQLGALKLMFTQEPSSRVQIRNVARDRMIQLQNGRMHFNWLGSGADYPRYEVLLKEFLVKVRALEGFLETEKLGELRPNQWEITYINHLPIGTVWQSPEDWVKLFKVPVSMPTRLAGSQIESVNGEWHYEIPPKRGRLHVQLVHGRKHESEADLLIFTLTARGPVMVEKEPHLDFVGGLDLGHATIVKGFAELCSEEAIKHWERLT